MRNDEDYDIERSESGAPIHRHRERHSGVMSGKLVASVAT
jgi:hypothetical protein